MRSQIEQIMREIKNGSINAGPRQHYSMGLGYGLIQAYLCGYSRIAAMEFGVAGGDGFRSLCQAASVYSAHVGMDIQVIGFDNACGLPDNVGDYRDHPEIWQLGQFNMGDAATFSANLPPNGNLIIGDISDTIVEFNNLFAQDDRQIAFISMDLDYYSSTTHALKILDLPSRCFVPAVPVYMDDVTTLLTYSEFCGAELAVHESNQLRPLRKMAAKPNFNVHNMWLAHVMDHPVRTGEQRPLEPFQIEAI